MYKVFITGATGFIGSHLADLLKEQNYNIYCQVRKSSNLRWVENKGYNLVNLENLDNSEIAKLFAEFDYIYHVGGLTAAKNYDEFLKGNRDSTKHLLELAHKYSKNLKRFVYVSSQTVCGPAKSLNQPTLESDSCNPITSYGKSKREAELEVLKYKDILPITIVRPPAVYGPRDTAILSVFQTVNMGIGTLIGFNDKYVSLIHSDDLVKGIKLAGESEVSKGEIYFISSEEYYNWNQLIDIMKNKLNKKFVFKIKLPHFLVLTIAGISGFFGKFSKKPPVFNFEKGIDFIQDYWICSTEKAKKHLGFKQNTSIEKGMESTIQWYKQNNWLK